MCLLLQSAQDTKGVRYKVTDNIGNIFTRFVHEGKCTIRLKEPAHDLVIQADPLLLKSFLRVIKLAFDKNASKSEPKVPVLNEKYFRPKVQTKCVVTSNAEYPTLQGFPRTTQHLVIADLQRKSFDRQILRLDQLRLLDLSKNCIRSLPAELGTLPNLAELILAENQLGKSPKTSWTWLNGDAIKKKLVTLDLGKNELTWLPPFLGQLTGLWTLSLNHNFLTTLPGNLGLLSSLRCLNIHENRLLGLPGSARRLRLETINISGNPFTWNERVSQIPSFDQCIVSSLVESAAKATLRARLKYDAETIPRGLVKYLDSARYCDCGGACFENHVHAFLEFDFRRVSERCVFSAGSYAPVECYFCSARCMRSWSRPR